MLHITYMAWIDTQLDRWNIRKAESAYLLAMHLIALAGIVHLCFNTHYLLKVHP